MLPGSVRKGLKSCCKRPGSLPYSCIGALGLQWQQGLWVLHHHSASLRLGIRPKVTYVTKVQGLKCTGFKDSDCFLNALFP